MEYLAELSGENVDFARYEFSCILGSEGIDFQVVEETGEEAAGSGGTGTQERLFRFTSDSESGDLRAALRRAGLCQRVFRIFGSAADAVKEKKQKKGKRNIASFGIDTVRYGNRTPEGKAQVQSLRSQIGESLSQDLRVDLTDPDIWIYLVSLENEILAAEQVWIRDKKEFAGREVENRPFFSPVSLLPKLALAMVNCTGLSPKEAEKEVGKEAESESARPSVIRPPVILDPFCGTGGILMEAGLAGFHPVGCDLDARMTEGSGKNLEHYGITDYSLGVGDISDLRDTLENMGIEKVDAVVSDFPYGRASTTFRESTGDLYERAFSSIASVLESGSRAVVTLPSREAAIEIGGKHLEMLEIFENYVHRSLTRYFCVFEKK